MRNPVIEEEPVRETEEENGVASVVAEEKAQTWIRKSDNKEKVDEQDENVSRFKLRNGREVSLIFFNFFIFHFYSCIYFDFLGPNLSRLKYCILFASFLCFV